jgi:hypothetical protein
MYLKTLQLIYVKGKFNSIWTLHNNRCVYGEAHVATAQGGAVCGQQLATCFTLAALLCMTDPKMSPACDVGRSDCGIARAAFFLNMQTQKHGKALNHIRNVETVSV